MVITRLGKRYAKSILDLALEMQVQDAVKTDMEKIIATLDSSRELRNLVKSPVVKPEKKIAIFRELFQNELSELSRHFLEIITRKGREANLENIARGYLELYRAHQGVARAVVSSAVALNEEQRQKIRTRLKEQTGMDIEIEEKIDPSLIGGIKLRVGDMQYDGSIASQLKTFQRQFKRNLYVPEF